MQLRNLFTASQHWLLLTNSSDTNIQTCYFPIDSNVYFIEETHYGYSIKTYYKTSLNSGLAGNLLGTWTKYGYREVYNKFEERKNRHLMRESLKISYVVKDMDTIAHLEDYQYVHIRGVFKKNGNFDLLKELFLRLNSKYFSLQKCTIFSENYIKYHTFMPVK